MISVSRDTSPSARLHPTLLPLKVATLGYEVQNTFLLHGVNLSLTTAGITVLLGHNGAGKSLLLRLLHGLLTPTTGSVHWNGQPISDISVRKQQAMVFQKPIVLRRTVAANIDYVLSLRNAASAERRHDLLSAARLINQSQQQATSLSGGEQQRLAIARALATDPSVIFLDEPTASMDPAATAAIEQQVQEISRQGIKVMMVTHDIAQARRLADDIVFLHQGTVTDHTDAADFFATSHSLPAKNYLTGQL